MPVERMRSGHQRFRQRFRREGELFAELADRGQRPQVLWIGCSDSRIVPEQIVDADAGQLFVVRNVANLVPPSRADNGAVGAALEYGLLHLGIRHIVVCGHTDCGGIRALAAAAADRREAHIAGWLAWARPAWEEVRKRNLPPEVQHLETVRLNVLLQQSHLMSYAVVADTREAVALEFHAWMYDLRAGELQAFDAGAGEWRPIARAARGEEV